MSQPSDPSLSDYENRILDCVKKHGWFCPFVFDPKGEEPHFAYSVGFSETLKSAEFIVFGLDQQLMNSMLWEVFRQIQEGKVPADGQRWSNLIQGYDCVSRRLHPTNIIPEYLNSAIWFWGDPEKKGPLDVFQLVWPGNGSGLFPWEDDCPQLVRDQQPPLYLPRCKTNMA